MSHTVTPPATVTPTAGRQSLAARIDAGTPANRDRLLDGLRAVAIIGVFLGHWLVGGTVVQPDGHLSVASPLDTLGFLAPASWVLQMLAVFFLVGGRTGALSWTRAEARGEGYRRWLLSRLGRLTRPVLVALGCWVVLGIAGWLLGVPIATLRTAGTVMVQPLWFIAIYIVLTALTPVALRLDTRFGLRAPIAMAAAVLVVDALRYGPLADSMPGWIGLLNLLPGWLFGYQLGVRWFRGTPRRRTVLTMLTAGVILFALLICVFDYPASMVGGTDTIRTNANPPSLLVIALATVQIAIVWLAENRLRAFFQRPVAWAVAVLLNLAAITILCWHQVAALIPAAVAAPFGTVPGLTDAPDSMAWVALRVAWMPVFGILLTGLWALMKRFESPRRPRRVTPAVEQPR